MRACWHLMQADVVAHIVIVFGLLYKHFHVGPHIPHALLHSAEAGGVAIAAVSTLAAAAAEVLSMRRLTTHKPQNATGQEQKHNPTETVASTQSNASAADTHSMSQSDHSGQDHGPSQGVTSTQNSFGNGTYSLSQSGSEAISVSRVSDSEPDTLSHAERGNTRHTQGTDGQHKAQTG